MFIGDSKKVRFCTILIPPWSFSSLRLLLRENKALSVKSLSVLGMSIFLSAKYLELTDIEKKKFTIEMLFNIYETNFDDKSINKEINNHLYVYDYCYSLMNK